MTKLRTSGGRSFVVMVALLATAGLLAATAGSAFAETVSGTLELSHRDDFSGRASHDSYRLATPGGRKLELSLRRLPSSVRPGAPARVVGKRRGRRLKVRRMRAGKPMARTAVNASGVKKLAVVLLNFQDAPAERPWTLDQARGYVFGDADSTNAFYKEETGGDLSFEGKYRSDGDVYGWITVPFDRSGCQADQWIANARAQLDQQLALEGKNSSGYDHFHYGWPPTTCGFGGGSSITAQGSYTACNGNVQTWCIAHEFGHWLGLGHANGYLCRSDSGSQDVPINGASRCRVEQYLDPFSMMGVPGTTYEHNGQHKSEAGILTGDVFEIAANGSYALAPSEPGYTGHQLLLIPRNRKPLGIGDDKFILDFRQPFGFFDQFPSYSLATQGVAIRVDDDATTKGGTSLIDMNPDTDGGWGELNDAPLVAGNTLDDPDSGVRITTESTGPAGAQVNVHLPGAEVQGSKLRYRAWQGEANDVTITGSAGAYTVTDRGSSAVEPGDGCTATADPQVVSCGDPAIDSIEVETMDRDDRVTIDSPTPATLDGGDGSDTLAGGAGDDVLSGARHKFGRDILRGGAGTDTVDYSQRLDRKLKLDLDGRQDDGASGERDLIGADVENILGGAGDDLIDGNNVVNILRGNAGNDKISGDDGNDTIEGGPGRDTLKGEDDVDSFLAIDGERDKLYCGTGADPFPVADAIDVLRSC